MNESKRLTRRFLSLCALRTFPLGAALPVLAVAPAESGLPIFASCTLAAVACAVASLLAQPARVLIAAHGGAVATMAAGLLTTVGLVLLAEGRSVVPFALCAIALAAGWALGAGALELWFGELDARAERTRAWVFDLCVLSVGATASGAMLALTADGDSLDLAADAYAAAIVAGAGVLATGVAGRGRRHVPVRRLRTRTAGTWAPATVELALSAGGTAVAATTLALLAPPYLLATVPLAPARALWLGALVLLAVLAVLLGTVLEQARPSIGPAWPAAFATTIACLVLVLAEATPSCVPLFAVACAGLAHLHAGHRRLLRTLVATGRDAGLGASLSGNLRIVAAASALVTGLLAETLGGGLALLYLTLAFLAPVTIAVVLRAFASGLGR